MDDDHLLAAKTAVSATVLDNEASTLASGSVADKAFFPAFPVATAEECARLDAQLNEAGVQTIQSTTRSREALRETALPAVSVSEFPAPLPELTCSLHRLDREEARQRMVMVLNEAAAGLPRGFKMDRLLATVRPVFVPRWLLQGYIQGQWQAQGVDVTSWEEACPVCHGSGRTGFGEQQRDCERCWGSGKEKQSRKTRQPETGNATVQRREIIDNLADGLALPTPQATALSTTPFLLPEALRAKLTCLRPASIYIGSTLDGFRNRLGAQLHAQAQTNLKRYSRVEEFLLQPETVQSQAQAAVWLYPAYLAWEETREGQFLVLCDALEGQVQWSLQEAAGASGTQNHDQRDVQANYWLLVAGGILIILVVALLAWYAGTL